jgi:hypothetical protein
MIGQHVKDALSPVLFLVAMTGIAALVLSLCDGCRAVEDPSAQASDVVGALARGVRAADKACASLARSKGDEHLAKDCAFAYDAARLSLTAADEMIDDNDLVGVPCNVAQALAYTRQMAALIERRGGQLPAALMRALSVAPLLSETCHG